MVNFDAYYWSHLIREEDGTTTDTAQFAMAAADQNQHTVSHGQTYRFYHMHLTRWNKTGLKPNKQTSYFYVASILRSTSRPHHQCQRQTQILIDNVNSHTLTAYADWSLSSTCLLVGFSQLFTMPDEYNDHLVKETSELIPSVVIHVCLICCNLKSLTQQCQSVNSAC